MTGYQFDQIFQRKINQPYSDMYGVQQRNDLYKEALISSIELMYKNLDEQREYDYLNYMISTNLEVDLTSSEVLLNDISPEYFHLLACRIVCKDYDWNATVTNYNVATQTITLNKKTALRSGELVNPAHGSIYLYVKQIGTFQYVLYNDAALTDIYGSVLPNLELSRYVSYWGKPIASDDKIDPFQDASIYFPRYEISVRSLKILPPAVKVILDYLRQPLLGIDCQDQSIDLEAFYPYKFLIFIAERAAEKFSLETKDSNFGVLKNEGFQDINGRAL